MTACSGRIARRPVSVITATVIIVLTAALTWSILFLMDTYDGIINIWAWGSIGGGLLLGLLALMTWKGAAGVLASAWAAVAISLPFCLGLSWPGFRTAPENVDQLAVWVIIPALGLVGLIAAAVLLSLPSARSFAAHRKFSSIE
jgi:hypothetical protein